VTQAQRAVAQADQGVADAQHGVASAQRGLADAYVGVTAAEQNYAKAQEAERRAQVSLNLAREQAIQDLKALHLQLADQAESEQAAAVRLFDQQQIAAGSGITLANAQAIAAQQVTLANEDQIKAALDLVAAQNALNDSQNSGVQLRAKAATADKAGVDGAQGVVSAQDALRNAHEQVLSSSAGVAKAHQAVADAAYGLEQANRGLERAQVAVTDAAYNEQKAHRAVADAAYQRQHAAQQVTAAEQTLTDATAAASRTLDIHTQAGQQTLGMLLTLWNAIQTSGLSTQDKYNAMIADTARAFGGSTSAAADYLKQLGLIPKDFRYSVTAVAQVDPSSMRNLANYLATGVPGGAMNLFGFPIPGHADGGLIDGYSPHSKADNLLMWSTANEFVQPVDAVEHYGVDFMEAVRTKRLPKFADGGLVGANLVGALAGANYQANVTALTVMGLPHPAGLPVYVPPLPVEQGSYAPGGGVSRWDPQILQALSMLGQDPGWLGTVERRMNQESGGNPVAINLWDSNAKRGTPSVGLMQVIAPTFRAYAGPYANTGPFLAGVSTDPEANTYAGLNYAEHHYGTLAALNRPGGYANGAVVSTPQLAHIAEDGPEAIIPLTKPARAAQVMTQAGLGGSRHYHLTVVQAGNSEIDLREQFRRLERAAGP
jgi:hypothetical protein